MTFQKDVCYCDLAAMLTIQGLLLAKTCNKRNSKNQMLHVNHTWVDGV